MACSVQRRNCGFVDMGEPPVFQEISHNPLSSLGRWWSGSRLERLAQASELPVRVDLIYARDRYEALDKLLDAASVVLIPVKGLDPQMHERWLITKLLKHGHHVIVVPCH